jgi:hypothetical protein
MPELINTATDIRFAAMLIVHGPQQESIKDLSSRLTGRGGRAARRNAMASISRKPALHRR